MWPRNPVHIECTHKTLNSKRLELETAKEIQAEIFAALALRRRRDDRPKAGASMS